MIEHFEGIDVNCAGAPAQARGALRVSRGGWRLDFTLSEEQRAFQEAAREFAANELAPFAAQWDEDCVFPVDCLAKAGEVGFGGIYVRDDVGGAGLGRLDAALIFEELARGCSSTAAYISIHNMAAWMIDAFGGDALRQRLLPGLARLTCRASYCLSVPGAGSDAAALKTRARRDGDEYVVNGVKAFISGGGRADVYVTMVRTADDGARGITCLVVEKESPGLSFGKQEKKLGWHSGMAGASTSRRARWAGRRRVSIRRASIWASASSSERGSPTFRRFASSSPKWPPSSRPRGSWCTTRP